MFGKICGASLRMQFLPFSHIKAVNTLHLFVLRGGSGENTKESGCLRQLRVISVETQTDIKNPVKVNSPDLL